MSTRLLTRVLAAFEFGLVALATTLVATLELLTRIRFDVPLIQHQNPARKYYDTGWTLNLLLAGALAVLRLIVSVPAGSLFDEPRLSSVSGALALSNVIDGAPNIGIVNL